MSKKNAKPADSNVATMEVEATEVKMTKKDRVLSFLQENPEASAADVQKHFEKEFGETVSANYISMCKGGTGRTRSVNVSSAIEQLVKVKSLVTELGGADEVRKALEIAARYTECVGPGNELQSLDQLASLS